jgi:hypothetical protein
MFSKGSHTSLGSSVGNLRDVSTSRRVVLLGLGAWALDRTVGAVEETETTPTATPTPGEVFPSDTPANAEAVHAFLGEYGFVGGPKERAALAKAIDELVAKMSFISRGIARDKLTETNPIASAVSFAANAKVLTTRFDKRAFTGPLDGRPAKVTAISGDTMEMRYRIADGQVRQWIAGDEKGQINTFHLRGQRLTQHVRVYASQLPGDLLYTLTYERG